MKLNETNINLYRPVTSYEVPLENMYISKYGGSPSKYSIEDSLELDKYLHSNPKLGKKILIDSEYSEGKEIINHVVYDLGGVYVSISKLHGRDTYTPLEELGNTNDLKDGLIHYSVNAVYNLTYEDKLREFLDGVNPFLKVKKENQPELNLVVSSDGSFYLKTYPIKKFELDINGDYSANISEKHDKILEKLNTTNRNGILFLHGDPGTGKSYYIRHLITSLKKKVIYLPPDMSHLISSPEFIPFLTDHPNSILLVEDAENIIGKRKNGEGNQAIANLLNLSDGLLSDALSIQLICTFNADKKEIDEALLRKGRLIDILEFKALEIDKAQSLSDRLGFDTKITSPKTLAEIYNQDDDVNVIKKPNRIGY